MAAGVQDRRGRPEPRISPRRGVAELDRQEGAHGGHRDRPVRLRPRAHAREPPGVPGRRAARPLRRAAARVPGPAVDRPRRAARSPPSSTSPRASSSGPSARARGRSPTGSTARRVDPPLAHDDLERVSRARLPRLPPPRSHLRRDEPRLPARRPVPQRRRVLRAHRRGGLLRGRRRGARVPPLARALVDVPVARRLEPRVHAGPPAARRRVRRDPSPSASRRSRSRSSSACWGDDGPRRPHPPRPDRAEVVEAPLRPEARQPREQAEAPDHRGRDRARRRRRRRVARGARVRGPVLLHPGLPSPGALHRGAGRHQRREELPERRRLGGAPLLRHREGRRLPRRARRTCTGWRSCR